VLRFWIPVAQWVARLMGRKGCMPEIPQCRDRKSLDFKTLQHHLRQSTMCVINFLCFLSFFVSFVFCSFPIFLRVQSKTWLPTPEARLRDRKWLTGRDGWNAGDGPHGSKPNPIFRKPEPWFSRNKVDCGWTGGTGLHSAKPRKGDRYFIALGCLINR